MKQFDELNLIISNKLHAKATEINRAWTYVFEFGVEHWEEEFNKGTDISNRSQEEIAQRNQLWQKTPALFIEFIQGFRTPANNEVEKYVLQGLQNMNEDPLRYIYEILQNADDCNYSTGHSTFHLAFLQGNKIKVTYNEVGMNYRDILSLTTVGQSTKGNKIDKKLIGEKGIGFKTIFGACEQVDIDSGGYSFSLIRGSLAPVPKVEISDKTLEGTCLILTLESEDILKFRQSYLELKKKYGFPEGQESFNYTSAFQHCPVMFTNHVRSMTVTYFEEESFSIEKVETEESSDFTIISKYNGVNIAEIPCYTQKQSHVFDFKDYHSRYPDLLDNEEDYKKIKPSDLEYDVILVAPLHCPSVEYGNLYSFLPTGSHIKAPINAQIPFKLSENRSSMYFDSQGKTILWNDKLIEVFRNLLPKFLQGLQGKTSLFSYIPRFTKENHGFFVENQSTTLLNAYTKDDIFSIFEEFPYFQTYEPKSYCSSKEAMMFPSHYYDIIEKDKLQQILTQTPLEGLEFVPFDEKAEKTCDIFGFKLQQWQKIKEYPVFPVRRGDNRVDYVSFQGNYFFYTCNSNFFSYGQLCFPNWDIESVVKSSFKDMLYHGGKETEEVFLSIITILLGNPQSNDLLYEELFDFLCREHNKEDCYTYSCAILKGEDKGDFWKVSNVNLLHQYFQKGKEIPVNNRDMKFHCLALLSHSKKRGTAFLLLPPPEWNSDYCKVLNAIEYTENLKFTLAEEDSFSKIEVIEGLENRKIEEILSEFGDRNIKVTHLLHYKLPEDVDFVRFQNTIILDSDHLTKRNLEACVNSITEGMGILMNFREQTRKFTSDEMQEPKFLNKENLLILTKLSALVSHYTIDERPKLGTDHDILNELLQNANDKCAGEKMTITLSKNFIQLSYAEKVGFTLKDYIGLTATGKSGHFDETGGHDGATGKKGTGFKSVYTDFKKVVVKSLGVTCVLDDSLKLKPLNLKSNDIVGEIETEPRKVGDKIHYYPVPFFQGEYDGSSSMTQLTFYFATEEKKAKYFNIFSQGFENMYQKLLFLKNISVFRFVGEREFVFDKKQYLQEHFYLKQDFGLYENEDVALLFPKKLDNFESCLYVGLPVVDETYFKNLPFHCNLPKLDLKDDRNQVYSLSDRLPFMQNKNGRTSSFYKLVTQFCKDYPQIAYQYFPFQLYSDVDLRPTLEDIPFLATVQHTEGSKVKMKSLWELYSDETRLGTFVFLPDYFYFANSHNKFSTVPFSLTFSSQSCYPTEHFSFVYYQDSEEHPNNKSSFYSFFQELKRVKNLKSYQKTLLYRENEPLILLSDLYNHFELIFFKPYREEIIQENSVEYEILKRFLHSNTVPNVILLVRILSRWYFGEFLCGRDYYYFPNSAETLLQGELQVDDRTYYNLALLLGGLEQLVIEYNRDFREQMDFSEEIRFNTFASVREYLYLNKGIVVEETDPFLDYVLSKGRKEKQLGKLHLFSRELSDLNTQSERRITLFENGKIVVKTKSETYVFSDYPNLFHSKVVESNYIVDSPTWANVPNLDKLIAEGNLSSIPDYILNSAFPVYLKKVNYQWHIAPIFQQMSRIFSLYNKEIIREIQGETLELSWNTNCAFHFTAHEVSLPSSQVWEQCENRIDQSSLNRTVVFFGESLTLWSLLKTKVMVYTQTTKKNQWTLAFSSNQPYILVFGEKSFGLMLEELFSEKNYSSPKTFTPMYSCPTFPLKGYDDWSKEDVFPDLPILFQNIQASGSQQNVFSALFSEFQQLQRMESEEKEYTSLLKAKMIQEFQLRHNGKWFCFEGYGNREYQQKKCPICGSVLIHEQTALRIKKVQAFPGTLLPILLCLTCQDAFAYANHIYFANEEKEFYTKEGFIVALQSKEPIQLCFDMSAQEIKLFPLFLTLWHRCYLLYLIGMG